MAAATEALRAPSKDAKDAEPQAAAAEEAAPAAPKKGGGLKPWLPLIVAVVTMPALAFATTRFVLLPRLQKSLDSAGQRSSDASAGSASSSTDDSGKTGTPKLKVTVPITKLLVNVAGTMGTRYLMTSLTLVGNTADFKSKIDDNKDQLMDLATTTLSSKTISDLEKPGARNEIRSELLTVLNNALGGSVIQEIYITELAIQ